MTTSQRLTAGTLLGGRYRLIEPVPGTGRTWQARDEIDGRALLARIVVLPDGLRDAERDRARHEALHDAAMVSRAGHPGIAHVIDAVVDRGVPWVVSVAPPGRSLGDVVRRNGPIPPAEAVRIGLQVLDALIAAGVPHGDLTPDDVLLGEDGRVTVTGFATTPVDGTGTRGFRAPEGGPGSTADLWSLGVTLHVAVEGRLPGGAPSRVGSLRPALDRLLDPNPARRLDPGAVRRLLVEAAGEPPVVRAPTSVASEIHDPEIAAALAAFDAALPTPRTGPRAETARQSAPVPTPQSTAPPPGRLPAAEAGPQAVATRQPEPETRADPQAAADPQPEPDPSPTADTEQPAEPRPATPADTEQPAAPRPPITAEDEQPAEPRPPVTADTEQPAEPRPPTTAQAERQARPAGRAAPWAPNPAVSDPPGPRASQPGPYPPRGGPPQQPEPDRRRRRQMLGAGAAVLAVLAVLVALLLPFLLGRDNDSGQPAPQAQPTATASTPQPTETTPSPDAAAPPPAGYRLYKDPAGWSVAVPTGWTATRKGAAVSFTSGDRILRVTVGGNPPRDPYDAALELEPVVKAATPGYDFMRIARVTYRGWPTADWEYRAGTSTRTHSLIRSIVPNPRRVYDILCTTEDRRWAADRTFFDIAARTFDPGS